MIACVAAGVHDFVNGIDDCVCSPFAVVSCQRVKDAVGVTGRAVAAAGVGVAGFGAYIMLVVMLADLVLPLNWAIVLLFFLAAGTLWTWPALRLLRWAMAAPEPRS